MLGPLPYFHRVAVVVAVLLTAVGSGAWIGHFTPVPVALSGGSRLTREPVAAARLSTFPENSRPP